MLRRPFSLVLAAAIVFATPGSQGFVVFAGDVFDPRTKTIQSAYPTEPKVEEILKKLDDPKFRERATKDQIDQMRSFLTKFKGDIKDQESPDAQAALTQLTKDLDDQNKDVGLTMARIFDALSPAARQATEGDNYVQVINQGPKSQAVRVYDTRSNQTLFDQQSTEIAENTYKKVITRPDPDDPRRQVIDAIVVEKKEGAATVQRVIYNRRVELLLKNLKKLYYEQPSLARKIKENCNVPDPANHQGIAVDVRADKVDEQMDKGGCEAMLKFFDGKRADFVKYTKVPEFNNIDILGYLDKLAAAAKNGTLDKLDWKELQAVQRRAMQFYNDNQLETMQKMVLIELKTYFSQVTNAQVKENKDTANLDATMKDLDQLQGIFNEFKKGNFQGYSMLMTKFFAKADIEDPKYVSKDIMLLASEAFADVANAVSAQKRMLQGGLTGDEVDATIEESQQWLRLAQVHLQEFDMHTLAIQLERLQSGHLRDRLGLRVEDLKFIGDDGKEQVLSSAENKDQALKLVNIAKQQYLPQLEQINGEIKANLVKQAISNFYMTYQNVTRANLYDDTMQERVSSMASKVTELHDLYLSMVFDRVKNLPSFKGVRVKNDKGEDVTEEAKLKGNLFELFISRLSQDNPDVAKAATDLEVLAAKLNDLAKVRSAEGVRADVGPLYAEYVRLAKIIMKEATAGKDQSIPDPDAVKKDAQRLSIKQSKIFSAVNDFSSQARIYDMMNELDLYVCKYASSDSCYSSGDNTLSKAVSMKWWDGFMSWITGGLRDKAIDGTMKYNPLTSKAFKMLGENKQERYRIMKLMAEGRFQDAIDRIAALDKKGAKKAWDDYQADKAIEDPFEMMDFDGTMTHTPDNKNMVMAQGVIQNMFGQLQPYIMGYTLTAGVYDTLIVSALTLGLGAASRYAIGAAKGIIAMGEVMEVGKSAEAVAEIERMGFVLRTLTKIGRFIINIPANVVQYFGKWLESSMISIRNVAGIANIGKDVGLGEKSLIILREGFKNVLIMNLKNDAIMAGASAGIQAVSYKLDPASSQFKSAGQAAWEGAAQGFGFGAKSGLIILMSPVPVSAFGSGTMGNLVRGVADSAGPLSSLTQGVAKLVATDSTVAEIGPLGALKQVTMASSPAMYTAAKMLVWSGAMIDGAAKYMLASFVFHDVASVGAYYEYKLTHRDEEAKGETSEGATVELNALSQGEQFGMTMAEVSWLLLPVHQQSNAQSMKDQIAREDGFNAAVNQGLAPEIAQARNGQDVVFDKTWGTQTWGERAAETAKKIAAKVTGEAYEPPKGRINVDGDLRSRANKIEMEGFSDAQLLDVATTPRENIGKYRLKGELGADFDRATYSNEPIEPGAGAGAAAFSKPTQGGEVDLRGASIRVTDEAITTAKDMLGRKLSGRLERASDLIPGRLSAKRDAAGDFRLDVLRSDDSFTFKRTGADGKTVEVTVSGDRFKSFRDMVANIDLQEQGRSERGTFWQKLSDMWKGRPIENGAQAMVRNIKNGVETELSKETAAESAELEAAGAEVREAARQLKEKAGKLLSAPESVEGTADEIKAAAKKTLEAAQKLQKAADRINDPKAQADAQAVMRSVETLTKMAESDKFTADGIGATEAEIKKSSSKLVSISEVLKSAGETIAGSGSRLSAVEVSRQVIDSVNGQVTDRITAKMDEARRLRGAGRIEAADALEREALALKTVRKSIEADAFLDFTNEKLGQDFKAFRRGTLDKAQMGRSIDQFIETWEQGVFGERWGTATTTFDAQGEAQRKWEIPKEYQFVGRDGGAIPEFRGPQKAMLKDILTSMAEGNQMTMGLLRTSGGKTLLSFVLLSFMDTMARQKGKQGATYITINGDLVAQAYEDYRAFFKGRDPRFEIRTVSDFMADQAMADASGGLSPFKQRDVVFDEYDLLGTITALSLGADNGRLSQPLLDPVQRVLHQGVEELKAFFDAHAAEIGKDADGAKLAKLIQGDGAFAKEFRELRNKYVNLTRSAIDDVRGSDFKQAIVDLKEPVFDAQAGKIVFKDSGLTREQFTTKYGMSPEQVVKEMREEHDHAFGGGWRKFWDVGVIQRQQGGLDGYVTKTFLGGLQALSKPDLAKFYDAELDPSGKKLVQYHNDVPLDNLDTLYRSFLELKHGIPLTLDFDNLTVVDFAKLNIAAKESGATLVAVSGTLPKKLEVFMKDLGWHIEGTPPEGKALDYMLLDPIHKSVHETISLMKAGGSEKEIASRMATMDIAPEGQKAVTELLAKGDVDAAVAKLAEVAPPNTMYREVIHEIFDLTKSNAGSKDPRNLGLFYAESKAEYKRFERQMDSLNPKYANDAAEASRFRDLDTKSRDLAERMKQIRTDPTAKAEYARLKAEYQAIEEQLDPMRMIPKTRRVVAVTPDSNFLVQEWLMPEGRESKNLETLRDGEADVVILIGQSGFRGLDLPFKSSGKYNNGRLEMYIADPGSLSLVNRRQLVGRIDVGRMPKGATSKIIGIVREQSLVEASAYGQISSKAFSELVSNGAASRWNGLQGIMKDRVGPGEKVDAASIERFLKTPPKEGDAEAAQTYHNVEYLYQDFKTLTELSRVVKLDEIMTALKADALMRQTLSKSLDAEAVQSDPRSYAEVMKLAARPEIAKLLLKPDAIASIENDLQAIEEDKSLEASGIKNGIPPNALQLLIQKLKGIRLGRGAAVPPTPIPAAAN